MVPNHFPCSLNLKKPMMMWKQLNVIQQSSFQKFKKLSFRDTSSNQQWITKMLFSNLKVFCKWMNSHGHNKYLNTITQITQRNSPSLLDCADLHHHLNVLRHHPTLHSHPPCPLLPSCPLLAYWVLPKQGIYTCYLVIKRFCFNCRSYMASNEM